MTSVASYIGREQESSLCKTRFEVAILHPRFACIGGIVMSMNEEHFVAESIGKGKIINLAIGSLNLLMKPKHTSGVK